MELTQLTFAVDTTPLDTADKKIRGLGEALKTIKQPLDDIVTGFDGLGDGIGKGVGGGGSNGPLVRPLKTIEANLEKVSTAMKIFRGETVDVGEEVVNLGSSFTKSQANFLALQKQLGASADQLKSFAKEFNDFNRITSANTFDNSIAGVQRLTKDIRELSEVNKLAAANTTLTRDQVMNLVRDTERLQQAMQSMGKSNDEINASIAQQTQQYVNLANEKNKLIAQTKAMEDSARAAASAELERAKASAYVTKEAEKLAFVNAQLKEGFTVGSANALYKYKEALDLTAMSADQAKAKLAAFGEQLKSKQSSSPFAALVKDAEETRKQVNHLARDVSVQLGDIAISLAGGQNPFMVMIQQGDQIRGALMRAKDSGVDSSNAIRNALGMMADSFVDVGKMAGTFFVGSIESAGNAVKRLVAEKTFLGATIDMVNAKMLAQGGVSANLASYIQKLGTFFTFLAGTAIVGATLALATFTVAQLAVIKESDNLVRSIHSQGAAFGVSSEEANKMITSLSSVGVSSSKAAQAMQAMIEGGKQSKESFALVAEAATLMSTYVGTSIDKTVKEFDKIADAPSKALIELGKATGYVTLEMVQEVQQLEKVGATQEAVRRATEILAEAKKKAAGDIARDLSAVATAWIEIKRTASEAFDAFKNSAVSEGVLNLISGAMKYIAITAYAATAGLKTLAKYLSTADLKEYETYRDEQAKGMYAFIDSLNAAKIAAGGLTAEQKQQNNAALAGAEATEKLNKAISGGVKDNVKAMTQGAYVAARMTEELQKAGQGAVYSADLQKTAVAKFKKEYEELTKVKSGPKSPKPKETFSIATDNTVAETKKSLDTQLKLVKEFENNRRDALKNAYESGIISRGEYLAQETAMTIDAFESQQQVIDKYQQYLDSFNQRRINIIKAYDDAIAKGGNKQELAKQLSNELANLDRAANGASETLDAMRASLSAATDKRFTESWKESNKALMESKKAYEEFESTVNNANQERQSEIQLQIQLSSAHGAEAEAIKASTAAMKSYAPAINKMALELRKAQQEYDNFMSNIDYSDDSKFEAQMLDAARLQKNLAQQRTNYNNAVALARRDSEQAATDASTKYQIEKYNELKGTLSDSIYAAIFEGGKQGGDVLKNYLMKEFKNFAIKVFIEPIVGSIMGGFTGGSGAGASSSAGGGGVMGTIGNIISTGSTVMKMLTNPMVLGNQMAQGVVAVGDALFKAGFEQMGNAVTGWASTANASAILGSIGSVVGGYGVSKLIGNGYKTGLGDAVDIAGAVGSYFFGPVAGVVSGLVNRAFGRKLKDTGIEGTFSNAGFEGQNYQFYKGGWLRSDKTTYSEMDQTMENLLSYQFKQLQLSTAILATSIGASVDSIKDFTKKIKVSFKGLDEKQINEKLTEVYDEISNEMAAGVLRSLVKSSEPAKFEGLDIKENILGIEFTKLSQLEASVAVWNKSIETGFDAAGNKLSEGWIRQLGDAVNQANDILDSQTEKLIESYQWFGETFSETLKRLSSSITTVNESFKDLGYTLVDVSLQGASKASDIISLFGGEDQYVQATGYFYDKAYTQEEKAANLTNRLSEALGRVNEELPENIAGYRDLVDAYAKQGDAGREVWASLVQLFPAFEQLVNLNEDIADSFNNLLGNYYEKFGTETERVAFQTGLLQKSLADVGIELPKTREEYVLQVKAYQNLGDAGREVLTVLLENADAFDALYPAIKSVADYYNELTNAVKSNEGIAKERISLEERLFNATATTAQIAEKARNSIDPMNLALYDTVIAAETLKDTNRILKESSSDKQNADLRLLQAQGKTAEAEALQRNIFIAGLEDLTEVQKEAKIAAYDYSKSIDKQISSFQRSKQFMQEMQGLVVGADIRLAQSKGDTKEVERLQQEQFESGLSKDYSPSQREALIAGYKYGQMIDKKIIADKEILDNTRARAEANIKLLTAEGKAEEAATAARNLYKSSLVDLTDAQIEARMVVYDYGVEIDKKIEALQKLKTIEQERLGLENTLLSLLGYTNILRQRELENLDESNRSLQQHIWLVEDSRTATDKALESVKQLGEAQISELQKSFDTTDAALSKVQRSIDAQKEEINKRLEAAQEAESNMTVIFELLSSAISDLLGQVKDDTGSIQYRQARDIISSALSTGTLPSQDVLSTAVGSATAGLSDLSFATKVERDRAYLGLSNELEGLKKIAEPQMTSSQQQVKLLQDQLLVLDNQAKIAQAVVDSVRGVDTSVTTVDSAIEDLRRSAASEESARDQIAVIEKQIQTAQLQYDVLRNIDTGVKSLEQALLSFAGAVNAERAAVASASSAVGFRSQYDAGPQAIRVFGSSANGIILDVGTDWSTERVANQIKSNIASFNRTGNTAAVAELEAYAKSKGIPAFADGGYYQGGLALVGEEGPELINFDKPGMVYSSAQSSGILQDNSELADELRALRQEVQMLRAEARATAVNTSKTARILDDVTQGGDSLKTTTA